MRANKPSFVVNQPLNINTKNSRNAISRQKINKKPEDLKDRGVGIERGNENSGWLQKKKKDKQKQKETEAHRKLENKMKAML